MPAPTNPWLQFLEDQPRTAFLGAADSYLGSAQGNTVANRRNLDAVFGRAFDDFNQEIGRRSLANENPDLLFSNFAQGLDFTRRFAEVNNQIPVQQRFNPRTRRLYFG
jgi:hypothetical protein